MKIFKIFYMSVIGISLMGFGAVLAYQPRTTSQIQQDFISCLEENLLNTNNNCFSKLKQ